MAKQGLSNIKHLPLLEYFVDLVQEAGTFLVGSVPACSQHGTAS
jgi:hypothetical protein